MPRLFYDEPKHAKGVLPKMNMEIGSDQSPSLKYLEKVSKLVPTEIVVAYMTLIGLVPLIHFNVTSWINIGIFLICLILTPVYLRKQADHNKPLRNHLILSSIAFMVWAYTISGDKIIPHYYDAALGSIALIIFTLVSGIIPLDK